MREAGEGEDRRALVDEEARWMVRVSSLEVMVGCGSGGVVDDAHKGVKDEGDDEDESGYEGWGGM